MASCVSELKLGKLEMKTIYKITDWGIANEKRE